MEDELGLGIFEIIYLLVVFGIGIGGAIFWTRMFVTGANRQPLKRNRGTRLGDDAASRRN